MPYRVLLSVEMKQQALHAAAQQSIPRRPATTMRFAGRFGIHISGADVAMLRTDLFDLWFQPDEMDEPVAFRREGDADSLIRLLFSQCSQG